jgi:hypothetical protein
MSFSFSILRARTIIFIFHSQNLRQEQEVLTSQKYKQESGENCFLREIREGVRSGGKIMKLTGNTSVKLINAKKLLILQFTW